MWRSFLGSHSVSVGVLRCSRRTPMHEPVPSERESGMAWNVFQNVVSLRGSGCVCLDADGRSCDFASLARALGPHVATPPLLSRAVQ